MTQLLTPRDLCGMLKVSRVTLWRWVKSGILPAPVAIGPRNIRWPALVVDQWIESRRANTGLIVEAKLSETLSDKEKLQRPKKIKLYPRDGNASEHHATARKERPL